jgi:hypothetical protein
LTTPCALAGSAVPSTIAPMMAAAIFILPSRVTVL